MKNHVVYIASIFIFSCIIMSSSGSAQDINVIVHETFLSDTIGAEMVFDFEIINISLQQQTVFEVRTVNDLPSNWYSSLCFGEQCFSPGTDSVATTPPYPTPPLEPGDTLISSLHVTAVDNEGTANVQIQIGTFAHPDDRTVLDYTATAYPTSNESTEMSPAEYSLGQNYPNPFNPATRINYWLAEAGIVSIKVYDVLGNEIVSLINEYQSSGEHEIEFNGSQFSSGIYYYKLVSGSYSETRKMILEK